MLLGDASGGGSEEQEIVIIGMECNFGPSEFDGWDFGRSTSGDTQARW